MPFLSGLAIALPALCLLSSETAAPAAPGRRPIPNYDGRAAPGLPAADVLLLAPRVALYPLHLVAEYGLRRPVVGLVTLAEKSHVAGRVLGFFTWRDGDAGLFPTVSLRSDMKPLYGLSLFVDRAGHEDHDLRVRASGRDRNALFAAAEDRWRVLEDRTGRLTVSAVYQRTDDNAYYGIGPVTREDVRDYYLSDVLNAGVALDLHLGELSRGRLAAQVKRARFGGSEFQRDDRDERNPEALAIPVAAAPGFADGYHLVRAGLDVAIDTRRAFRPDHPGSGLRLDAAGDLAVDPGTRARSFLTWGAGVTGIVDLTGNEHLLALQIAASFVEALGDAPVPFTEQVTLGGPQHMRGFRVARFRDESAITAGLHYRYPIWLFADAELASSVGNVFRGHLAGFSAKHLYWSSGLSLKSNFSRETAIGFTAAIGSARFDADDFTLADSVRLFFGVGQGF